ncbi:hypothetical protein BDN71DRAFT_1540749 [Pleurotus eryngii]|uniref:Uncharacterized protein n=1 Tax=Pleurotus eryngii TaxID=5323 RepID=A0A9P6D8W9_PLEER|nr:hypothetical protein BDN71DRAFT_1540749 [Pleurotus eryngii]
MRANTHATGSVKVKLGFVSLNPAIPVDFHDVFSELVKRSRPSLVSAPPVLTFASCSTLVLLTIT